MNLDQDMKTTVCKWPSALDLINIEVERCIYIEIGLNPARNFPKRHGYPCITRGFLLSFYTILSKAGISVCASQKLNTSFGPVINNFGVSPLKKLVKPSFFIMLPTILNPLSGFSKFRFCILVFITSNGAETTKEAVAPAIDATKFCMKPAEL